MLASNCKSILFASRLVDQGHRVVGVEASQLAIEDFFKEHSMEYTAETQNGIPVFLVNI